MKKSITRSFQLAITLIFLQTLVKAQVSTIPFTAALDSFSIISGTILDAQNVDDVIYPNLSIGFTFSFGGKNHTTFSASTNGFIELDTTSQMMLFTPLNGSRNNIISPFGADLKNANSNASLQYTTIGTAPNRVTIVQWLHYSYFGSNIGDLNFQVRLYETSNCISFVYGANALLSTPLQTQIGLRGDTISDFIALGDTTCNWAAAYPYPSIFTNFPVSLSCNMPSGFAFEFGACYHGTSANFGYITGKVFDDQNGNGIADTGEPGLKSNIINVNPGNYFLSTDAGGNYAFFFFDSTLTYSITSSPKTWWNNTTPATKTVSPLTQSCSGNNFGLQVIPNIHEVSITSINWGAKPGQPEPMPISFYNNGTTAESDTITFEMDSLYSFISSTPAPASVSGQTITWIYPSLLPGNYGHISLNLLPSVNAVLGNYLNSTLTIYPLHTDTIPGNNIFPLHQLISNSWDPNDKTVEPQGVIAAGTTLNYTIHFQNTGNASADNVVVTDDLDTGLDPMTFKVTGFSHNLNWAMSGTGTATFTFFNIQLPDSGTDFAASNGYVSYSIQSRPGLAPLTLINNTAGIYFDYNPAVITNTVTDTIQGISSGVGSVAASNNIIVSPNPTTGTVVFVFDEKNNTSANLTITAVDGKIVFEKNNIRSGESVDLRPLNKGIYFSSVKTSKGTQVIKIVKD